MHLHFLHDETNGQNYKNSIEPNFAAKHKAKSSQTKRKRNSKNKIRIEISNDTKRSKHNWLLTGRKKTQNMKHTCCLSIFWHDFVDSVHLTLLPILAEKSSNLYIFRTTSFCLSSWKMFHIRVVFAFNYAVNWIQCYHSYDSNEYSCPHKPRV